MQIVIIGAGAIGSAIARDLVARDDIEGVRVCDSHARALQDLGRSVPNSKLQSFQVDARDRSALEPIIKGAHCVVGAGAPNFSPSLAKMALEGDSHYCDLGGPASMMRSHMKLGEEAKARGRWIVPGCGLAPGLVNILCVKGIEEFEHVEAAFIRVGDLPRVPVEPFNFQMTWSAEKILEDYTEPVQVVEDGLVRSVEPLEGLEQISFGQPFGELEAFHTAGSLSFLASSLEGRVDRLDHKTIRWPGHAAQMRFLLGLGFGEERIIDVQTHLTYRDVLKRRMRQRLSSEAADVVLMRVAVQGQKDGEARTLVFELEEGPDTDQGLSAMKRCTALPAASVACLLAAGAVEGGGVAPPETIIPKDALLAMVQGRGIEIRSCWHAGIVPVTEPLDPERT